MIREEAAQLVGESYPLIHRINKREKKEAKKRENDYYYVINRNVCRASGPALGVHPSCSEQTVRNSIRAFGRDGLEACLTRRSSRPHTIHAKVDAAGAAKLRAMLHRRVRRPWAVPPASGRCNLPPRSALPRVSPPRRSATRRSGTHCAAWACAGSAPNTGSPVLIRSTPEKKGAESSD